LILLAAALVIAQAPAPAQPGPNQPAPAQPAQPAPAQDPDADPLPELAAPDTAVGRHLAWVMRVVNRDEEPGDLADRFSDRFLEIYKPAKIAKELTTIRRDAFKDNRVFITRLNENDNSITATIVGEGTRRALSCLVVLDDTTGKMASLYFDRAEYGWGNNADGGNWDELAGRAGDMKGEASFGAYELILVPAKPDGAPANAANADRPRRKDTLSGDGYTLFPLHEFGLENRLAIAGLGSLFVMPPLADRIADATLTWDQRVTIDPNLCILPGSIIAADRADQADAPPAAIALATLAAALLDPADAAAADHAIALLTREALEKDVSGYVIDPLLLTPFLHRHEMLRVRSVIDQDNANAWEQLGGQYLRSDTAARRDILQDQVRFLTLSTQEAELLAKRQRSDQDPLPGEHLCSWYATPRDLANAVARVQVLAPREDMVPLRDAIASRAAGTAAELQGTPAAADPKVWSWESRSVAQEPGVIAAASILRRRDNRTFVLIAIQNHAERGVTMERMNDLLAKGRDIVGEYKFEAAKVEPVE
jgi:hypothetical protein